MDWYTSVEKREDGSGWNVAIYCEIGHVAFADVIPSTEIDPDNGIDDEATVKKEVEDNCSIGTCYSCLVGH